LEGNSYWKVIVIGRKGNKMIELPCIHRLDKSRRLVCGKIQERYYCILFNKYVTINNCKECEKRKERKEKVNN